MAKRILHLEGLAVFVFCLYFYWLNDLSWLLFFLLLLTPDLSMVGYVFNNEFGARLYNLFHTYMVSLAVIFLGMFLSNATFLDRKSTRLNSSHVAISYAVFCLKKKNIN